MLQFPSIQIEPVSALPARKWRLTAEGMWRRRALADCETEDTPEGFESFPSLPLAPEMPLYTPEVYDAKLSSAQWTLPETDRLMGLCREFNLNFLIVHDRFNCGLAAEAKSVEEIRERYFEVKGKVDVLSGLTELFSYDKEYDMKRRALLESYHSRPKEQGQDDAYIHEYFSHLEASGNLRTRLADRINLIKLLAGDQFTAGWPTLPELLKIAAGKGSRFVVANGTGVSKKKKKKLKKTAEGDQGTTTAARDQSPLKPTKGSQLKRPTSVSSGGGGSVVKKPKPSGSSANVNIYLRSSRLHPLRVGTARAVEKILADNGLGFKPDLSTEAVVAKFDQVRQAIVQLIDLKKARSP